MLAACGGGSVDTLSSARLLMVTAQQRSTLPGLAATSGSRAVDGKTIPQADLDKAS